MQLHADWAVTLGCADACPYVPTVVEDWHIPDPAGGPIEEVRAIRGQNRSKGREAGASGSPLADEFETRRFADGESRVRRRGARAL